ncbi:MAG: hypothetical protein ACJAXZ_000647, partial [Akkermansiaceae bacterium]
MLGKEVLKGFTELGQLGRNDSLTITLLRVVIVVIIVILR